MTDPYTAIQSLISLGLILGICGLWALDEA